MNVERVEKARLPPGLLLELEAISRAQEERLLDACRQLRLVGYAADPGNRRSSASFGWKYDFANDSFVPCAPLPAEFSEVCAIAATIAGVMPGEMIECLVNRYETGSYIQPHCDKPVFDRVVGLSLGSPAIMVFSKPENLGGDSVEVSLPARSIYLMSGESRHVYRHALPPVAEPRWSISFRTLSPAGQALRGSLAVQAGGAAGNTAATTHS